MDKCPQCGTVVNTATVTENGETISYKGCHECDWIGPYEKENRRHNP